MTYTNDCLWSTQIRFKQAIDCCTDYQMKARRNFDLTSGSDKASAIYTSRENSCVLIILWLLCTMNFLQRSRALQTSCHHVLKSLRDCSKASSLPLYSKTATMATIGTPQSQNTASLEVEACVSQDTNSSFFLGLNPSRPQSNLVNFTSAEGKRLFRGAMDQGQAESFFKLMGNFSTQSSAMLGGISSRKSSDIVRCKSGFLTLFFFLLSSYHGIKCTGN